MNRRVVGVMYPPWFSVTDPSGWAVTTFVLWRRTWMSPVAGSRWMIDVFPSLRRFGSPRLPRPRSRVSVSCVVSPGRFSRKLAAMYLTTFLGNLIFLSTPKSRRVTGWRDAPFACNPLTRRTTSSLAIGPVLHDIILVWSSAPRWSRATDIPALECITVTPN